VLLIAVDTSTRRGSVALRADGAAVGEVRLDLESGHSGWLVGAVEGLLCAAGRSPEALDALAVATGPGSFTGLRVGLATVQGLALARGLPCLGVSTLDLLARGVRGRGPRIAAVMDAWRGEVYAAEYDGEGRPSAPPAVLSPAGLASRVGAEPWVLVGDGALRYREALAAACPRASFPEADLFLAGALAELAEEGLGRGEGQPAAQLRPVYLRPPALRRAPA